MSILPHLLLLLLAVGCATSMLVAIPRSTRYGVMRRYAEPEMFMEHKRYDRNCFFSPVQCMLTYNDETRLPMVVTRKASGRKRFDPLE